MGLFLVIIIGQLLLEMRSVGQTERIRLSFDFKLHEKQNATYVLDRRGKGFLLVAILRVLSIAVERRCCRFD